MNGLNFHDEMVAKISNRSEMSNLGRTYTQSYNDWLDKHDAEIRAESLAEALKPYDAESVEDLVRNVRNKTIDEILQTIRNGMSELLESPWANNKSYMSSHDFAVRETMSIIDDLILKKDIEQMKEGEKNG